MTNKAMRVTLTYDVEGLNLTDDEAVQRVRKAFEDGEVMNWYVQDLPELGTGRWEQQ